MLLIEENVNDNCDDNATKDNYFDAANQWLRAGADDVNYVRDRDDDGFIYGRDDKDDENIDDDGDEGEHTWKLMQMTMIVMAMKALICGRWQPC